MSVVASVGRFIKKELKLRLLKSPNFGISCGKEKFF
jgi:hypothetical protein